PLTIFIGPNNAGKTWLAYTLAGIFGHYGWRKYAQAYTFENVQETYPTLDAAIQQTLSEGTAKIDLVQFIKEDGEKYINNVARLAKHWMKEFMRTDRVSFENLDVCINLTEINTRML